MQLPHRKKKRLFEVLYRTGYFYHAIFQNFLDELNIKYLKIVNSQNAFIILFFKDDIKIKTETRIMATSV